MGCARCAVSNMVQPHATTRFTRCALAFGYGHCRTRARCAKCLITQRTCLCHDTRLVVFAAVAKLATTFERTMWARFNHGVRISTHARLSCAQGNLAHGRKVGLQLLHTQTQCVRRLDGFYLVHGSAALSLCRTPADVRAR